MSDIPAGFTPAEFAPGFLDHSGPYFLGHADGARVLGLRVREEHRNYVGLAHGGLLTTFADVALSFLVHDSERPRLNVVTNTLTTNFLGPARPGDWLEAHGRIDRIGKQIAYTSGQIRRDGEVLMTMSAVFTILRPPGS